ncbi:MAG: RICIN domain-containing protein [Oscillospiraceae bacterium]|nr:RICIN domain-containing protein [Oscillospiraceae bacterium]
MKHGQILAVLLAAVLALPAGLPAHAAGTGVSVHDPSIIKDGGTYYVFGSHIDAARSTDLIKWRTFTNGYTTPGNVEFGDLSQNLAKAFAWAGEDLGDCEGGFAVWAPDVIWDADYVNADGSKGAYLMYFCTSSTWNTSVIAYAAAQTVEGPYTFVDTLIYSGFTSNDSYATSSTKNVNRKYTTTNIDELIAAGEVTYNNSWFDGTGYNYRVCPNAIDPTIYYSPDGTMYMVYGSWSGGIFTLEMDPATGRCIRPKTGTTDDGRMVDSYFGTKLAGGYHKSGEGPFIEYNADTGYYYLWETYGGLFSTGGYNMRVFRSLSPTGPFTDPAGRSGIMTASSNLDSTGLKVMGNYKFSTLDRAYMACGHNSVLQDDDGQWYLFYHARFDDGSEYHEVRVHPMWFNEDGWPVVSPFAYAGDTMEPGGYEESDIVGSYEFINHGNATDGEIIGYSDITLNADGTISGAVTGTWSQAQDSAAAVLNIGGTVYKGYFLAAQNEKGTKVMSFTAVGSNNQTVWGAKNTAFTGTGRAANFDYTDTGSRLVYAPGSAQGSGAQVYLGDTSLLSGVSYSIRNVNSDLVLDLEGGATQDGTNIQQWGKTGGAHQEWRITAVDDTYCKIASLADEGTVLSVAQSSADDGVNIELQTYTGADNQLWRLVKNGISYGIVSKCSGDTAGLDVYEWSKANGGNVNQWNFWGGECQLWYLDPVHPAVNSGTYTIRNLGSGLYVHDELGNAEQSATADVWTVTQTGDAYTLQNARGQYLTVEGASAENGADLRLDAARDDKSQLFTFLCNRDGSYALLSEVSGGERGMDVYEISTQPGANLCQWEYWGGDGQKFILEPAQPVTTVLRGDVNADGAFTLTDVVMMQKYLVRLGRLNDYDMGDMNEDGRLDVLDLALMKQALLA